MYAGDSLAITVAGRVSHRSSSNSDRGDFKKSDYRPVPAHDERDERDEHDNQHTDLGPDPDPSIQEPDRGV